MVVLGTTTMRFTSDAAVPRRHHRLDATDARTAGIGE